MSGKAPSTVPADDFVTPLVVAFSALEIKNRVMAQARESRADSFSARIEGSVPIVAYGNADFRLGTAIESSLGV